jgi:hypothetical protein
MKRFAITAVLALALAGTLEAKPWYKKPFVWATVASNQLSAAFATIEAHDCRVRESVAFCAGGYGPFAAREWDRNLLAGGFSALAILGSRDGRKHIKVWFAPPLGLTAYDTYTAYDQTLKGCPAGFWPAYGAKFTCTNGWKDINQSIERKETFHATTHFDLSGVVFVPRK